MRQISIYHRKVRVVTVAVGNSILWPSIRGEEFAPARERGVAKL